MSNLRLISKQSATSGVSSFSVTDVFSADFDIYKVVLEQQDYSADNNVYMRLINSSGSVITASEYDYAVHELLTYNTYGEARATNQNKWDKIIRGDAVTSNNGGAVYYFFNPYSSSKYTFQLGQQAGASDGTTTILGKGIAVFTQLSSITGFQFTPGSGTIDTLVISVYGLRVDS